MSDIFISYSKSDRKKAEALANALKQQGRSVWWDEGIAPGSAPPWDQIGGQIGLAKCVLVLWSKNSVRSTSVQREADAGDKRNILIPVIIEKGLKEANIPFQFQTFPPARILEWKDVSSHAEFKKLLAAINELLAADVKQTPVPEPVGLKGIRRWCLMLALGLAAVSVLAYLLLTNFPKDIAGPGGYWEFGLESPKITWVKPGGPAFNLLQEGDEILQINLVLNVVNKETQKKEERQIYSVNKESEEQRQIGGQNGIKLNEAIKQIKPGDNYRIFVKRGEKLVDYELSSPPHSTQAGEANLIVAFIHVLFIGFSIPLTFDPQRTHRRGKISWSEEVTKTYRRFLKGWCAVWITWLVLYLHMAISWLLAAKYEEACEPCYASVIDFLNISNSVAFFYIFLTLDMPSIQGKEESARVERFRSALKWVFAICSFVMLLSFLGRFNLLKLREISPSLSGILVAISMAYVFGRLGSHYINVKRWRLAPLNLYAAIQVIGPNLIELKAEAFQTTFFVIVLVLKIFLFIIFYTWQRDGVFEKYIKEASRQAQSKLTKKASHA